MVREPSVYKEINIVVRPVYSISIMANPANPDNGEDAAVYAILKDGDTPLPGKEIVWTVEQGAGTFTPVRSTTDADGIVHTVFQPTGSGSMIVRASLAENPSKYQDLPLNVGSSFKLGVSASPPALSTGGTTTLTALLKDGNVPAAGHSLTWSIYPAEAGPGLCLQPRKHGSGRHCRGCLYGHKTGECFNSRVSCLGQQYLCGDKSGDKSQLSSYFQHCSQFRPNRGFRAA
jgi:Bacterial Ig-like domain (group 1).